MSFFLELFMRLKEIILGPFQDPLMWWEVGPILLALIITELYFNRYRKEKLGWNSSVSNSLVLIFVGSNLLHFLFLEDLVDFGTARSLVPVGLIVLGLLLFVLNYYHRWPAAIAFGLSSALVLNTFALTSIIVVHLGLSFDQYTFLAMLLFLLCLYIVFLLVGLLQTPADEE